MISVTVNGDKQEVPEGSVLELIHFFDLDKKWCIVELNAQALSREDYESTVVTEDDTIELIRAVAGG